jgi:putative (di)nucleoside polyphosphate hydrolase
MSAAYPEHRPNVGLVLFNAQGKVWLGKRYGADEPWCWQFPQGGMDEGEAPEEAGLRELYEETGVTQDLIEPLGAIADWLTYDFPPEVLAQRRKNRWRGQKQRWFAYRYLGTDADFDLKAVPPQEFSEFRWVSLETTPQLIIPWKRSVYDRVAEAFAPFSA